MLNRVGEGGELVMTFKEYVEGVNKMLEKNPELGNLEMEQTERLDNEEVRLPLHEENSKYYDSNKIYL
jgi:hypothetical protein